MFTALTEESSIIGMEEWTPAKENRVKEATRMLLQEQRSNKIGTLKMKKRLQV